MSHISTIFITQTYQTTTVRGSTYAHPDLSPITSWYCYPEMLHYVITCAHPDLSNVLAPN